MSVREQCFCCDTVRRFVRNTFSPRRRDWEHNTFVERKVDVELSTQPTEVSLEELESVLESLQKETLEAFKRHKQDMAAHDEFKRKGASL